MDQGQVTFLQMNEPKLAEKVDHHTFMVFTKFLLRKLCKQLIVQQDLNLKLKNTYDKIHSLIKDTSGLLHTFGLW